MEEALWQSRGLAVKMKQLIFIFFIAVFFVNGANLIAKSTAEIQEEIKNFEKELDRLQTQAKTLSNQILQFDAQIKVTELKINQTEEKILLLGGRIDQLESSLSSLVKAFSTRAKETYIMTRLQDAILIVASASDLREAVSRYQYLRLIQASDRELMLRLQTAQNSYKNQKSVQEELAELLENQKSVLDRQKKEKTSLLSVTRNDEKKYQELLITARAELAISLGQGNETFLRDVKEGEKIGTIISGRSGCSTGTHLHFEIHQGDTIMDPNNLLKQISFSYSDNYDISYYGSISPHGSWNWPMNEPIQINQGFGSHGYARVFYPGGTHNGFDLTSSDRTVKAVKDGKFYGGSYQCGGRNSGVLLYAKVDQGDGITAWYLHMTPL